jgi:hypothetical protein
MIGPPALIAGGTASWPSGGRACASLPMLAFTSPATKSTVSTMTMRTAVIVQMPHRRGGRVGRVGRALRVCVVVTVRRHPRFP